MIKSIIVFVFLSFVVALSAGAQDGDRIGQLEKEVQELKARLSKLESAPGNKSNANQSDTSQSDTRKVAPAEDGWRSVANWRKLQTDMSNSAVRRILGEPDRIEGGGVSHWYYQNGGTVTFIRDRTSQWAEPKQ
jgi:hypothetical protein